jgi:hypothetical protein
MSTAKHTPARDWTLRRTPNRGWFSVWDGETCIADVLTEPEARLIAACPHLLAELKAAESDLTEMLCARYLDSTSHAFSALRKRRDCIRAAITKAEVTEQGNP